MAGTSPVMTREPVRPRLVAVVAAATARTAGTRPFRHGPARPGHLSRHVRVWMAGTGRAMTRGWAGATAPVRARAEAHARAKARRITPRPPPTRTGVANWSTTSTELQSMLGRG